MRLLEGDEFVRGILEPAGLCLADVERSRRAGTSYRTLSVPEPAPSAASPLRCAVALFSSREYKRRGTLLLSHCGERG